MTKEQEDKIIEEAFKSDYWHRLWAFSYESSLIDTNIGVTFHNCIFFTRVEVDYYVADEDGMSGEYVRDYFNVQGISLFRRARKHYKELKTRQEAKAKAERNKRLAEQEEAYNKILSRKDMVLENLLNKTP